MKQFQPVNLSNISSEKDDTEILVKAVVFDPEKNKPFDTDYFLAMIGGVQDQNLTLRVRQDFWKKLGYHDEQNEESEYFISKEGIVQLGFTDIHEIYAKREISTKTEVVIDAKEVENKNKPKTESTQVDSTVEKEAVNIPEKKSSVTTIIQPKTKEAKEKLIASFLQKQRKTLLNRMKGQIEYYFGDKNYDRDQFLKDNIDSQGYLAIDVLLTFNKLLRLGATKELITEAIKNSVFCEISADGSKIRKVKL